MGGKLSFSAFAGNLLFVLYLAAWSSGTEITLQSPRWTNWGTWGNWETCPAGTVAIGFQLKVQGRQGAGIYSGHNDDSALNAISLLCGKPKQGNEVGHIKSLEGPFGSWTSKKWCGRNYYARGFQLRSEAYVGESASDGDDTAANNLRLYCTSLYTPYMYREPWKIEGSGMAWGQWTQRQLCPLGQALCAIRTQVQAAVTHHSDDNTALNNVEMKCCPVPYD